MAFTGKLAIKPFFYTLLFTSLGCAAAAGLFYLLGARWFLWLDESNVTYRHNIAAAADLNSDGLLDVVASGYREEGQSTIWAGSTLWLNQGEGQFSALPPNPAEDDPYYPWSAAPGDLDGDGDADLLGSSSERLLLALNQGGAQGGQPGTFRYARNGLRPYGALASAGKVLLGDLNSDGALDAFVASCCGMTDEKQDGSFVALALHSWVWFNQFRSPDQPVETGQVLPELDGLPIRAAALGDLDGDGDLDVYLAILAPEGLRQNDPADRVLFNDGAGNLVDSGQRLGEESSTAVALGDLDGDGDLDALVGTEAGATQYYNMGGAQGGERGVFTPAKKQIRGDQTEAVFLADFDGDGDLDALLAAAKRAALWWNDGVGVLSLSETNFRYTERHSVAVGDFIGGSLPDVFASLGGGEYRLWLNQGEGKFTDALR